MRLARAVQANVKRLDNRTERHPKQAATRRVAHQYQKHDTKPATRLQGGAKGVPRRSGMSFGNPVCRQMRGSINQTVSRGMGKNPPRFRCDHFSHVSRTYPSRRNMTSALAGSLSGEARQNFRDGKLLLRRENDGEGKCGQESSVRSVPSGSSGSSGRGDGGRAAPLRSWSSSHEAKEGPAGQAARRQTLETAETERRSTHASDLYPARPEPIPLTELGWRQSREVAVGWTETPDLILTSPYLRTRQTATATIERFPNVPVGVWPIEEFTYLQPSRWMDPSAASAKRVSFAPL